MTERRPPKQKWNNPGHCDGCTDLTFTVITTNRPPAIDANYWAQATAAGILCGQGNTGSIQVSAEGLIPFGVYTLWFMTDRGLRPAAPIGATYTADGFDPNRLVVNGQGQLDYYIAPLDYNPFRGTPMPGGMPAKIQQVVFAYHTDRTTHGLIPGDLNVNVFGQLTAPVRYPREDT